AAIILNSVGVERNFITISNENNITISHNTFSYNTAGKGGRMVIYNSDTAWQTALLAAIIPSGILQTIKIRGKPQYLELRFFFFYFDRMEKKLKLIWDFFGPDAKKTAEHHEIHLKEFIQI